MKTILTVEIKDNKTIATVTKLINGEHNLLLHKTYDSKPLSNSVLYDVSIIKVIKEDLQRMNILEIIDEKYLTINTKRVLIETFNIELKYDSDVESEKEKLRLGLEKKYPHLRINDLILSNNETALTKRIINATVELVEKEYLEEVISQFKFRGIKFDKVVPLIKAIENSTKTRAIENGITFSIIVEEKFTQLVTLENGVVTSAKKYGTGLTNIYDHISNIMNLDKKAAKKLFKAFGSIPPEDVVDDKVIHTIKHGKELEIFTKKDLSRYITEKVNELFANIKTMVDPIKDETNIRIVFNGEIKSLTGFKKYAAKSFAEPNIRKFKTRIIGLNEETEFITIGTLTEAKETISENNNLDLNAPKINVFNKLLRMYNYI